MSEVVKRVVLRAQEVVDAGYIGSKASLWREVKAGRFPPPIELGPNSTGWIVEELDAHVARRAAERTQAVP